MQKIQISVPQNIYSTLIDGDFQGRPYDICLSCPYAGRTCDGPNFLAMSHDRWVEWCNLRAKKLNLSRAHIADMAGLSKATVDSALSGRVSDIRASTMAAILRVLMAGCWGEYPCHFASVFINGDAETLDTSSAVDAQRKIDYLKADIAARDRRIAMLDEQAKDMNALASVYRRIIAALAVPTALFVAYLVYDAMHPEFGVVNDILAFFFH